MAKQTINIGDTGTQLVSKLGGNFNELYPISDALVLRQAKAFNILDYGAVGDNNSDNTTAIQACITAAAVSGGNVFIPKGIFKTHSLTIPTTTGYQYWVNITGEGRGSVLKSMAAETLLYVESTQSFFRRFSNFTIDGDNVGTIGLHLYLAAYFVLDNIEFYNIKTNGLKLTGSLIGKVNNCYWYNLNNDGNIGVYGEPIFYPIGDAKAGQIAYANNIVTFTGCVFYTQKKYAVSWNTGTLLKFIGCNLEWNGTTTDLTTGGIYYINDQEVITSYGVTAGLFVEGCWFESNAGIQVFIDDSGTAGRNSRHVISSSHFSYNYSPNPNIKAVGIVGNTYLTLRDTGLNDFTGLWAYGANCHIINDNSNLNPATLVLDSGATYRQIITREGLLKSTPQASAPSAPTEGEVYCGTDHHLYYFNGTIWKQLDN